MFHESRASCCLLSCFFCGFKFVAQLRERLAFLWRPEPDRGLGKVGEAAWRLIHLDADVPALPCLVSRFCLTVPIIFRHTSISSSVSLYDTYETVPELEYSPCGYPHRSAASKKAISMTWERTVFLPCHPSALLGLACPSYILSFATWN